MGQVEMIRMWLEAVVSSRWGHRDEAGGVLDESAMIFVGFSAAVVVAGAVWALINAIEIDIGELSGG